MFLNQLQKQGYLEFIQVSHKFGYDCICGGLYKDRYAKSLPSAVSHFSHHIKGINLVNDIVENEVWE